MSGEHSALPRQPSPAGDDLEADLLRYYARAYSRVKQLVGGPKVWRFGMTIDLHEYSLSIIFLVSVVFMLAASEAGRLHGVRAIGRGGDDVSTLESAILGLLALLISFYLRYGTVTLRSPARCSLNRG